MKPVYKQQRNKVQKHSWLDLVAEVYGWFQIVFASLIVGLIVGFMVYLSKPGQARLIIGIAIMAASLIVGGILATNAWKRKGLPYFGSNTKARPRPGSTEEQK